MAPFDTVLEHYDFPVEVRPGVAFVPHPLQVGTINTLAPYPSQGHYNDMGTGKTFMATAVALYRHVHFGVKVLIILPPGLILQWCLWLRMITKKATGKPLVALPYRGTIAKRAKLREKFDESDFIVVGAQIFRQERLIFHDYFRDKPTQVIIDEATVIAWIGTVIHDAVYDFTRGCDVMVLTGTPAGKPLKAYGLCKFTNPEAYVSLAWFKTQHVLSYDQYEMPVEFQHLDKLQEALMKNSVRVLYGDMYKGSEEPHFDAKYYELAGAHDALYRKLAEEKLLELLDGGKIDATTTGRLNHALNQIICNWDFFAQDDKCKSAIYEQIDDSMDELPKLVIFAHYKMTIASMTKKLAKYGAVGYNSDLTSKEKEAALWNFINNPNCRIIVIQYRSGGVGLDGMQYVCNRIMCIESCSDSDMFKQAIARLKRTGQKLRVHVQIMIASGTLQVRAFKALLTNDDIACQTIRNAYQLRDMIYGRGERL